MEQTKAMQEREITLKAKWNDENYGYYSLIAHGPFGDLAYIAIPETHPLSGVNYMDLEDEPDVNGGITFSSENVFGWDYCHAYNRSHPAQDIKNALFFFKAHES